VVEVLHKGGDIISNANNTLPQDSEFTLKLQKVEVSGVLEIFSILDGWVITASSYIQLAIKLKF
jgi:hypothetical protein